MVRAHASCAEGLRFEPDSMPWLSARSLFTQQQMGTQWEHWGDKGGEERNWPPYLKCRWPGISVLSNRHFPNVRKYTGLPLPLYLYSVCINYFQQHTYMFYISLKFSLSSGNLLSVSILTEIVVEGQRRFWEWEKTVVVIYNYNYKYNY